jgi:hypothetical protein
LIKTQIHANPNPQSTGNQIHATTNLTATKYLRERRGQERKGKKKKRKKKRGDRRLKTEENE